MKRLHPKRIRRQATDWEKVLLKDTFVMTVIQNIGEGKSRLKKFIWKIIQ